MPSKEVERAVLAVCLKTVPGFPDGLARDSESPDFLVSVGNRTIGIEMQEFIQGASVAGAPAREAESIRATVMRMAQQEFESRHPDTYLYVYASWNRSTALNRRTAPDVARQLAFLVENLMPPSPAPGQVMSRREASYLDLENTALADRLTHLHVLLYSPATYGLWASPEWGIASRDLDDLKAQIQAKESKIATYRQSCDEIWLVVYALALPSGGFDMEALGGERIESSFDHVVFLDAVSGTYALLAG